jgi:hypothetical protein
VADVQASRSQPGDAVPFHAPARFDRNRIIAGIDIAGINDDMPAEVHIDAVASRAADGKVTGGEILAINGVHRPHACMPIGKTLEQDILAFDGFDEHCAARHLPAAQGRIACDVAMTHDGDTLGVPGGDQCAPAVYPAPFPTHLGGRIIVEIRAAGKPQAQTLSQNPCERSGPIMNSVPARPQDGVQWPTVVRAGCNAAGDYL